MKSSFLIVLAISAILCCINHVSADSYSYQRKRSKPSKAYCWDPYFPRCFAIPQTCPHHCPTLCEVDCRTCKAYCACDRPGAVCQDPRFIGGDGIMFYFHGKKDKDFCLVSDSHVHINAHFIGKRSQKGRDFTWVQSIVILFGSQRLHIGAKKVAQWNSFDDNMFIKLNGENFNLPSGQGSVRSSSEIQLSIQRVAEENDIVIEVEEMFNIRARVVPITAEESRVHGYDINDDDCFAHLELSFKFNSLSSSVNGVLGQTYAPGYQSRVKIGAAMPIMGGAEKFSSSDIFATDCAVSQFGLKRDDGDNEDTELDGLPRIE